MNTSVNSGIFDDILQIGMLITINPFVNPYDVSLINNFTISLVFLKSATSPTLRGLK